jgi:predicted amidohydrolase
MDRKVCAAAIQFNITLGEVDTNLQQAVEGIRKVRKRGARLAVLPEMWSTGYDYKRFPELSEQTPRVVETLKGLTSELQMVVVGSLPEKDNGHIYNTAYVIDQGQVVGTYRKLHLFSNMGEDRFISSGNKTLVVPTSVGRIGVAICYDLRFPELFRKLALEGTEILCLSAEWPKPRQDHWRTLLQARAIENQLFVVAANCCGIQGKLDFFGMSLLITPRGQVLAEGDENNVELTALFDFEEMVNYRSQIRCYQDRRPDVYSSLP